MKRIAKWFVAPIALGLVVLSGCGDKKEGTGSGPPAGYQGSKSGEKGGDKKQP